MVHESDKFQMWNRLYYECYKKRYFYVWLKFDLCMAPVLFRLLFGGNSWSKILCFMVLFEFCDRIQNHYDITLFWGLIYAHDEYWWNQIKQIILIYLFLKWNYTINFCMRVKVVLNNKESKMMRWQELLLLCIIWQFLKLGLWFMCMECWESLEWRWFPFLVWYVC